MAKDRMYFFISFIVLGFVAAFLFRSADMSTSSIPSPEKKGNEHTLSVLVAKKNLNPQDTLTRDSYSWEKVDANSADPMNIVWSPQTEVLVNNATVLKEITPGQKLKRSDISWPDGSEIVSRRTIKKTPGKIAVPFELTARSAIVQFMSPGMFVDVTFTSKANIGFGTVSLTLLRNVQILAIGQTTAAIGRPNTPIEVLLEMTPRQAEVFFYAQSAGNVSLSFLDTTITPTENELAGLLMASDSSNDFHSILVTYIMRNLFPGVQVKITATPKGYIASGKVPDPQMAGKIFEILEKLAPEGEKNIVNLMEIKPQQVLLSVKVLEVSRNVHSRLGVNWSVIFQGGGGEVATLASVFPAPPPSDPNYFLSATGINFGDFSITALLNMLDEEGVARVLAEPNLTTVSGATAHFFAGGEFPILIPQGGTLAGTVTVEYKKYGVLLDFTPHVDLNGLITLHVVPEVSTLDRANGVVLAGFIIPGLITRRVDTIVKLWPGQSYIIAGLLENENLKVNDHLYCLSQLPIIGPLFSSKDFKERQTELMIVITPFLSSSDPEECCQIQEEANAYYKEQIKEVNYLWEHVDPYAPNPDCDCDFSEFNIEQTNFDYDRHGCLGCDQCLTIP